MLDSGGVSGTWVFDLIEIVALEAVEEVRHYRKRVFKERVIA